MPVPGQDTAAVKVLELHRVVFGPGSVVSGQVAKVEAGFVATVLAVVRAVRKDL